MHFIAWFPAAVCQSGLGLAIRGTASCTMSACTNLLPAAHAASHTSRQDDIVSACSASSGQLRQAIKAMKADCTWCIEKKELVQLFQRLQQAGCPTHTHTLVACCFVAKYLCIVVASVIALSSATLCQHHCHCVATALQPPLLCHVVARAQPLSLYCPCHCHCCSLAYAIASPLLPLPLAPSHSFACTLLGQQACCQAGALIG